MPNFKPLRLSNLAKKDLQIIAEYTLYEWGEAQKISYLGLIKKSFKTLSCMGNIGKKRDDLGKGLYSYTLKKHNIYFRETKQEFIVLRILHSKMEPERHLV